MPEVRLGAKFADYKVPEAGIKRYEESNYVCTYRRSSRSIESYKKRATKRDINDQVQFSLPRYQQQQRRKNNKDFLLYGTHVWFHYFYGEENSQVQNFTVRMRERKCRKYSHFDVRIIPLLAC